MTAKSKASQEFSQLKQRIIGLLLLSGHEAEKVSQYLQEDINDLAELSDYTRDVIDGIIQEDVQYTTGMIWDWMSHMTDKMELVLLSLKYQQFAENEIVESGLVIPRAGQLVCCHCLFQTDVVASSVIEACHQCESKSFFLV